MLPLNVPTLIILGGIIFPQTEVIDDLESRTEGKDRIDGTKAATYRWKIGNTYSFNFTINNFSGTVLIP